MSSLNLKWRWKNQKLTSSKCHLSCCLTVCLLVIGWDIMGYESETLSSYKDLGNFVYSIMLNDKYSPSTPKIHLPRPDPTISSSGFPAPALPWYRFHKWNRIPPVSLWLPDISECTSGWSVITRLPVLPTLGDFTIPCLPRVSPSSSWSVWQTNGETPPGPSTLTL